MHINTGGFNTLLINEWVLCGWVFSVVVVGGSIIANEKAAKQTLTEGLWIGLKGAAIIKLLESAKTGCIFIM